MPFDDESARISPDGNWVAYVNNKTGRREVYVAAYPALDRRRQVSSGGGSEPVWGPRNDEIFYRSGWDVFSVPLASGGSALRPGQPSKLFDGFFNRVDADKQEEESRNRQETNWAAYHVNLPTRPNRRSPHPHIPW